MTTPDDLIQLVHIGWDNAVDQPNPIYAWTKRGTSEAKCGESSQAKRVKDQCLFLRGFKLAFSQNFRMRMRREALQGSPDHPGSGAEASGSEFGGTGGGRDGNGGSPSTGRRNGGSSGSFYAGGSNAPGTTYEPTEGVQIEVFPESRSQVRGFCSFPSR